MNWTSPKQAALEVEWYRINGKFPAERIQRELTNHNEYVIGDWSWQQTRPQQPEVIEPLMAQYVAAKLEKEKR